MRGVAFIGAAGIGKTRLASLTLELAAERAWWPWPCGRRRAARPCPSGALAPLFDEVGLSPELEAGIRRGGGPRPSSSGGATGGWSSWSTTPRARRRVDRTVDQLRRAQRRLLGSSLSVPVGARRQRSSGCGRTSTSCASRSGPCPSATCAAWRSSRWADRSTAPPSRHWWRRAGQRAVPARAGPKCQESGALASELGLWRLKARSPTRLGYETSSKQRLTGLSDDEREALELVASPTAIPLSLLEQLVPLRAVERLEGRGLVDAPVGEKGPSCGSTTRSTGRSCVRTFLDPADPALPEPGRGGGVRRGPHRARRGCASRSAARRGRAGRLETLLAAGRTALRTEYYELATADGPGGAGTSPGRSRPLSC